MPAPNLRLEPEPKKHSDEVRWYALKTFYQRLFAVRDAAVEAGFTPYIAMTTIEEFKDGKTKYVEKPLIPSLMFLRCSENQLLAFKKLHNSDFMYYPKAGSNAPAPIDEMEMRSFIILTASDRKTRVEYLGESVPDFRRGEKVRVIDGIYKGAEGYIKKIKSDRKLIVELRGVAVVAVSYIHPSFLEKI